jgi:AcrR family transcriptional regulator
MSDPTRPPRRPYYAPRRAAAAERTRLAIVTAAKRRFEVDGWAGTTVKAIAEDAGCSIKTVEAAFGTKAVLLAAAVDLAIRGDLRPEPMPQRRPVAEMETASDARSMLDLHAAHLRRVNERSARLTWAVEHAARTDPAVAELWSRMNQNRRFGVRWAARTLLRKRGARRISRQEAERIFWVALDWGTYRLLTEQAGLDADGYEAWVAGYYSRMLLARSG